MEGFCENYNQLDLYNMWYDWIPSINNADQKQERKEYYVANPDWDYNFDPPEDEFIVLIDNGD